MSAAHSGHDRPVPIARCATLARPQTPRLPVPSVSLSKSLAVLIVDDNRDAADSLAIFLEFRGCKVRVVYDGPAAVQAALSDPPDCAVLDIGMPGLDGFSVARRLKSDPATAGVRLVALSGYVDGETGVDSATAGFDRYLVKGRVDADQVLGTLTELTAAGSDG